MQFINLKAQYERIKEKLDAEMIQTISEGTYIMGKRVLDLEARLAEYVGRKYCVTCSNGTDALTMPLMAYGIGEGDAVFVPSFTFFASAEVISLQKATPVFVDVDETYNMDAKSLENAIKTVAAEGKLNPKAIIAVDLFGQPARFDLICEIAKKNNLIVIEDGAQGFGGTLNGKKACSFGDVSTTSFFPAKPLGCYGDGGAIFTDDEELAIKLRSIRVHGSNPKDKYDNVTIGLNARLDTIQTPVLNCKLDIFDDELVKRQWAADLYTEKLAGLAVTPVVAENATSSWAQYTIRLESAEKRAKVMASMKEMGIPTMIYYPTPMHEQTAFKVNPCVNCGCENSELYSKTVMSLPMHPYLTEEEINTVVDAFKKSL